MYVYVTNMRVYECMHVCIYYVYMKAYTYGYTCRVTFEMIHYNGN